MLRRTRASEQCADLFGWWTLTLIRTIGLVENKPTQANCVGRLLASLESRLVELLIEQLFAA